jgi:hypothetical protein
VQRTALGRVCLCEAYRRKRHGEHVRAARLEDAPHLVMGLVWAGHVREDLRDKLPVHERSTANQLK